MSAAEIHCQLAEVYGENVMSRQHLAKWCRLFKSNRDDVEGRHAGSSGHQSSSVTEVNAVHVNKLIKQD